MDILLGPVVIHDARAVDVRAVALGGGDAHARRDLDANLGGGVRDHECLLQVGIANQRIHVTIGAVHGESSADANLCSGVPRIHGMLGRRAAHGDRAEEIRGGKGSGDHGRRLPIRFIFHCHIV